MHVDSTDIDQTSCSYPVVYTVQGIVQGHTMTRGNGDVVVVDHTHLRYELSNPSSRRSLHLVTSDNFTQVIPAEGTVTEMTQSGLATRLTIPGEGVYNIIVGHFSSTFDSSTGEFTSTFHGQIQFDFSDPGGWQHICAYLQ